MIYVYVYVVHVSTMFVHTCTVKTNKQNKTKKDNTKNQCIITNFFFGLFLCHGKEGSTLGYCGCSTKTEDEDNKQMSLLQNASLSSDTWRHILFVVDVQHDTAKIWMDGVAKVCANDDQEDKQEEKEISNFESVVSLSLKKDCSVEKVRTYLGSRPKNIFFSFNAYSTISDGSVRISDTHLDAHLADLCVFNADLSSDLPLCRKLFRHWMGGDDPRLVYQWVGKTCFKRHTEGTMQHMSHCKFSDVLCPTQDVEFISSLD
ncbi:hypothetical protein RFI_24106 [Reticulomyxa filosa]|uniref:Uncharacterized protein n=1 Tax=Reticulomyxa filosa TaxID=46433 RepID=X6MH97_RETFI|nr:hypothetical protein RFI_24106 [Reticulomyxa filosa]|eukprot:ETO13269.1 hypothetical protein RFI_24106 [Reticulomyxa filosa]